VLITASKSSLPLSLCIRLLCPVAAASGCSPLLSSLCFLTVACFWLRGAGPGTHLRGAQPFKEHRANSTAMGGLCPAPSCGCPTEANVPSALLTTQFLRTSDECQVRVNSSVLRQRSPIIVILYHKHTCVVLTFPYCPPRQSVVGLSCREQQQQQRARVQQASTTTQRSARPSGCAGGRLFRGRAEGGRAGAVGAGLPVSAARPAVLSCHLRFASRTIRARSCRTHSATARAPPIAVLPLCCCSVHGFLRGSGCQSAEFVGLLARVSCALAFAFLVCTRIVHPAAHDEDTDCGGKRRKCGARQRAVALADRWSFLARSDRSCKWQRQRSA